MAAINNETEWLNCEEPRDLARYCEGKLNVQRFRWLAVAWGQRVRDGEGFEDEYEQDLFDAFKSWVLNDTAYPKEMMEMAYYTPLDVPHRTVFYSRFYIREIRENNPMQASASAGLSVSHMYPMFQPTPPTLNATVDYSKTHVGKSKKHRATVVQRNHDEHRAWWNARESHRVEVCREFCDQFRDVSGNPFRTVTLNRRWLTDSVVQLAKTIDATGRYELLPFLADALQEADCESEELLAHCRDGKVHVRGCWAIDLLLDNSPRSTQ